MSEIRKAAWIRTSILGALLATMIGFGAILASCDQEHPQVAKPADGWIEMGKVSDSLGGCSVWKKKDDNGKTVYVAIGVNSCSVCAVDEAKK
jgi:hypothetical protein